MLIWNFVNFIFFFIILLYIESNVDSLGAIYEIGLQMSAFVEFPLTICYLKHLKEKKML
jgi:hypothetical protein